nr:MAG TPA: hypothetical protein [Caudoviricetes sp.]
MRFRVRQGLVDLRIECSGRQLFVPVLFRRLRALLVVRDLRLYLLRIQTFKFADGLVCSVQLFQQAVGTRRSCVQVRLWRIQLVDLRLQLFFQLPGVGVAKKLFGKFQCHVVSLLPFKYNIYVHNKRTPVKGSFSYHLKALKQPFKRRSGRVPVLPVHQFIHQSIQLRALFFLAPAVGVSLNELIQIFTGELCAQLFHVGETAFLVYLHAERRILLSVFILIRPKQLVIAQFFHALSNARYKRQRHQKFLLKQSLVFIPQLWEKCFHKVQIRIALRFHSKQFSENLRECKGRVSFPVFD